MICARKVALTLVAVMLAAAPALAQTGSTPPKSPPGLPAPPDPGTGLPSSSPPPDPGSSLTPAAPSAVDPRTGLPR